MFIELEVWSLYDPIFMHDGTCSSLFYSFSVASPIREC